MIEAWSITIKPEWLYDSFDHAPNGNNHIIILTKRMASFEIFKIDFFFFFVYRIRYFLRKLWKPSLHPNNTSFASLMSESNEFT